MVVLIEVRLGVPLVDLGELRRNDLLEDEEDEGGGHEQRYGCGEEVHDYRDEDGQKSEAKEVVHMHEFFVSHFLTKGATSVVFIVIL